MEVMKIPFVRHIGIEQATEGQLLLRENPARVNHLGTLHAGALYMLAETQSGLYLQQCFPAFEGEVVPLLREGCMKYKKPVENDVYAVAHVTEAILEKFENRFSKKGKGSITVTVELNNEAGEVCATGTFHWFIQKLS